VCCVCVVCVLSVCCVCVVCVLCMCCVCVVLYTCFFVHVLCMLVLYTCCIAHTFYWACLLYIFGCTCLQCTFRRMPSDHFVGTVLIKINNVFSFCFLHSRKCARLLQAVRWKLSRTRPRAQRKKLLKLYINTDILGCTATATRMVRSVRFNDKYFNAV